MNYRAVYEAIIAKYRTQSPEGYSEVHHVVPRCLGGSNDLSNLVALPARAHFVAHLLLAKIHGGKLVHAAFRMSNMGRYGNRRFAWLRQANSIFLKGNQNAAGNNTKKSDSHKRKIGVANSVALKGKTLSEAHKLAIREAMKNPDIRKKISDARRGKKMSLEQRKKIADSLRGTKRAPYNYKHKESGQ